MMEFYTCSVRAAQPSLPQQRATPRPIGARAQRRRLQLGELQVRSLQRRGRVAHDGHLLPDGQQLLLARAERSLEGVTAGIGLPF